MNFKNCSIAAAVILTAVLMIGCGDDANNATNPIVNFQPEVVNEVDAFQFQITDADAATGSLTYHWNNTGSQATVNHSTATISGSATIELLDANLVQVYSSPLAASANEQSNVGTPGIWLVRVTLSEFSGTANFRVEKM